jgi:hypothetical protein
MDIEPKGESSLGEPAPPVPPPQPRAATRNTLHIARTAFVVVLGIVLPLVLLTLAYQAVSRLDDQLVSGVDLAATAKSLPAAAQQLESPNDYALLLVTHLEASNQRIVSNKNRMKIAVMHIGFAVCCVGLLFVVLGIDAGGFEIGTAKEMGGVNVKIASSGVAVFVLGGAMAAAGGLLPNRYSTLGVPGFIEKGYGGSTEQAQRRVKKLSDSIAACEDGPATVDDFRKCTQAMRAAALSGKE